MAMELGQTAFGRLPPRYLRNGSFWKSRWCRNDGVVQLRVLKLRNSYYARFSKKAELVSLAGLGLGKARAAEALNTQRFATNTNRKFSDNYAAYGGNLNIRRYADGGDIDPQIDPRRAVATRQDSINVRDHSRNLLKSYMDQIYY
jgi:hypothetical protein